MPESRVVFEKNLGMLLLGIRWKTSTLWTRKVVECCMLWDCEARRAEIGKDLAHEFSQSKDFISSTATGRFCDISAKNLTVFCLSPEDLCEAKLKRNGQLGV